ncbi:transporter substrate-binding domain-containing protein [Desulfogranum mediterraneum]|uniref:transporter substrate-binding domain-containing protein n=1 Tax=Desulfogranum mediterraneum TaxID=160661 RepID=UPI00048C610C|nr:transporter substrate-binding domain-containing protein [Desulfogranum mediterraneum]
MELQGCFMGVFKTDHLFLHQSMILMKDSSPTHPLLIITAIILGLLCPSLSGFAGQEVELDLAEQEWLREKKLVRVFIGHWPPYMFADRKQGIIIEYLEYIFRQHQIEYTFITPDQLSWNEALADLSHNSQVDLIPAMVNTEQRREQLIFTDDYLFSQWMIFTRKDAPFISSINDLEGKSVIVRQGVLVQQLLEEHYPQLKLLPRKPDKKLGIRTFPELLAAGSGDALVANLTVMSYLIQTYGYTNLKVAAPVPLGSQNQAMAVRKDWPQLASIINKTLKRMTPEEHAAFRNKWFPIRYEHGLQVKDIIWWGLAVLATTSLLFITGFFYYQKLSRERERRTSAEAELQALRGILPLCCFCKKIRDDEGKWHEVDLYIQKNSAADVSHGICEECAQTHYPDLMNKK